MNKLKRIICAFSFILATLFLASAVFAYQGATAYASTEYGADEDAPNASGEVTGSGGVSLTLDSEDLSLSSAVRILLVLTVLALAPSILIMLTSYTRIIIVLHFLRSAMGTQTAPTNQVLIGLALFLTLFIMYPTITEINESAITPLEEGTITQYEALEACIVPLRTFMYGQTQESDLNLFCDIAGITYEDYDDVPFVVLVPSFIVSELRTAFIIGVLLYIPFIVIDMVVSSVLLSMGMMMLPPTTISLPFKVLLFVLADGWNLVIAGVVNTFY